MVVGGMRHRIAAGLLLLLLPQRASGFRSTPASSPGLVDRATIVSAHRRHHSRQIARVAMSGSCENEDELQKLRATLQNLKDDGFGAETLAPLENKIAELEGGPSEELQKLRATLQGLKDDGFGAEALAPLEVQIAALERQLNGFELPPLSEAQRAIWTLCDVIDAEDDSDADVRAANLRRERKFLLSSLQKADGEEYAQLLSLLERRATIISKDDLPTASTAAASSLRSSSSSSGTRAASLRAPKPMDESAEDPAAAAAALAEAEIEASLNEGVDPTFVRTFLWSEEERFGIAHLVIGERGWSRPQDKIRMRTWMGFATKVLEEGEDWPTAKMCLAMADPMMDPLNREAEGKAIYKDDVESEQDAGRVEARLRAAYADKRYFLMRWKDRVKREGFTPDVQLGGLSRVGQMRAMGKVSDTMSQTLEGEAEFDGISKLNKWFDDLMKGDK